MAREITDPAPRLMPMEAEPMIMTMGKVKPIAARGSVPKRDTKNVSVMLKRKMAREPPRPGQVREYNCLGMDPSSRVDFIFICC
jgi:hypothetical protein